MVYLGRSIINSKVEIAGMKNMSCLKNGVSNNSLEWSLEILFKIKRPIIDKKKIYQINLVGSSLKLFSRNIFNSKYSLNKLYC